MTGDREHRELAISSKFNLENDLGNEMQVEKRIVHFSCLHKDQSIT